MFRDKFTMIMTIMVFICSILITSTFMNKATFAKVEPDVIIQEATPASIEPGQEGREKNPTEEDFNNYETYKQVIDNTASMVYNESAQQIVQKYGLNMTNVTWEDTGRYKGSCVGPNISDMTIQVQQKYPGSDQYSYTYMPVIRYDNFSDKTADISPEKFYLLIGNEKGEDLKEVTLKDFLEDIPKYLHDPQSWQSETKSLLAERDTHVLVSAQACFLPVPKEGRAEFNPYLFNYQSLPEDPAVLTILATREGTSVSVGGQCLYFNQKGEKACFTGERLSDFLEQNQNGSEGNTVEANGESGLNMVLLIQVPLKQKNPMNFGYCTGGEEVSLSCCQNECKKDQSDVEAAVIGHGEAKGPFTEINNLEIERDPDFPVRVTVQYYKATGNGVISEQDMEEIREQIDKTYSQADYVGSLVVEGFTGRPTEYNGQKTEPNNWWQVFWSKYQGGLPGDNSNREEKI